MAEDKDKSTVDAQEALNEHRIYFNSDGSINMDLMSEEDKAYMMDMSQQALAAGLDNLTQFLHEFEEQLKVAQEDIASIDKPGTWQYEAWQQLCDLFPDADSFIDSVLNEQGMLGAVLFWIECLYPMVYDTEGLKDYIEKTGFTGSLADFVKTPAADPDTGKPADSILKKWTDSKVPSHVAHKVQDLDWPIDKINNTVWDSLKENTHGQMTFNIKADPVNSKKQVNLVYSINFDNIESSVPIVRHLTQYDKRVYIAVGALWKAGNDTVTLTQIYHAMGNQGIPGKKDREKIDKSMTKFHAIIYLSNAEEIAAGYNYPSHTYDGPLLPFYRDTERNRINGQFVNATYHITLKSPDTQIPLIQFAAERKQITTIPLKLLQAPVNKNEESLRIEDYLIERIERAKAGAQPAKILLSTLYENTDITTYKQKERAVTKIKKYLDYYVECGEIAGYIMDKKSITLDL